MYQIKARLVLVYHLHSLAGFCYYLFFDYFARSILTMVKPLNVSKYLVVRVHLMEENVDD